MKQCNNTKIKAFTLVEILVSITIFTIIITIITGSFASIIKAQRKNLAEQEILNQAGYALEFMSRALRMASKELSIPNCLSQNGKNYEDFLFGGINRLRFINSLESNDCQEFFLEDGQLKYRKGANGATSPFALTSPDLEVSYFNFNLSGEDQPPIDDFQPRVLISFEIKKRNTDYSPIRVQTTISQRKLDIQY